MRAKFREHLRLGTLPLRAAALTYYTFLALVPLAALGLALLELLQLATLAATVRRFFLAELGLVHEASLHIGALLTRADARVVGSLSGILFLISVSALVANVESALDEIFNAPGPRALKPRVIRYLALLTLGPVALGVSLFLTEHWRESLLGREPIPGLRWMLGPFGLAMAALFLLYRFGPNARVTNWAAAAGALVAGPIWELAKQLYAGLAARAYRQDAMIYGPLAAIPVLLLWIQLSWLIVLMGARVTVAVQGIRIK